MRQAEKGFLLLTSHLGDPCSKPLSVAQFRTLSRRMQAMERPEDNRPLTAQELLKIGYGEEQSRRIVALLSRQEQLEYYVNQGKKKNCYPIIRIGENYPRQLRDRLGTDCPGCLWAMGDSSLLEKPAISLVGSRELMADNINFAKEAGRQAARQGFVLISGNARGADRTAQDSCLENGGQVISILADRLDKQQAQTGVLYISEDGYDGDFSAARALSRNRLIHAMGKLTLVAQCTYGSGGTWKGCLQNLHSGYSPVFCFQDGSKGIHALLDMGAKAVDILDLADLSGLEPDALSVF